MPFDKKHVFDSDEMLSLEQLPRTLTVIGGGVIGVEYATIFSALDVPVTLIETRNTILDFVDSEIVDDFLHQMRDRGMAIRLGSTVKEIAVDKGSVEITLGDGRTVRSQIVLYAAGRSGNIGSLGLDTVGIEVDSRGRIKADPETFQTTVPNIYAAGDVIGFPSLASTAMEQGRVAACHAFGVSLPPPPETFPYGIYSVPEISTVGQSEEQVRSSGVAYEIGVARFRETSRGHIMGVDSGFLKLVFSIETRRLLGAHIVGEGATELIHIGQAVINLGGTVDFFVNNTFNYPTLAEAYKIAGLDAWNRMGRAEPFRSPPVAEAARQPAQDHDRAASSAKKLGLDVDSSCPRSSYGGQQLEEYPMPKMIFVNLPVADLKRATAFYEKIGATKNPQFSDETASCMVFSETIYAMLLTHEKYGQFTSKKIVDARTSSEVMIALSADSRDEVDGMVGKAKAAGVTHRSDADAGLRLHVRPQLRGSGRPHLGSGVDGRRGRNRRRSDRGRLTRKRRKNHDNHRIESRALSLVRQGRRGGGPLLCIAHPEFERGQHLGPGGRNAEWTTRFGQGRRVHARRRPVQRDAGRADGQLQPCGIVRHQLRRPGRGRPALGCAG